MPAIGLALWIGGAAGYAHVLDLNGRHVDPLRARPGVSATVLVFTSIDCPVSNRYAPELRRLHDTFVPRGVRFQLVFANPADRPSAIRDHVRAFDLPTNVLHDPRQDLVRRTKVTVTPEAAVLDSRGRIVYRGRIDDRYVDLGVDRQTPTTRDLEDAIVATLAGKAVANPVTQAVGCFLADSAR